jgi:hypothetical protein
MKKRCLLYKTEQNSRFKIEIKRGDDWWRDTIWITFKWFGKTYWLLIFIDV